MKKVIRKRRKDGVKQRYHIGKKNIRRKRFSDDQYKFATGIIKNKRKENIMFSKEFDRLSDKVDDRGLSARDRFVIEERRQAIRRDIIDNSTQIDRLNKLYFPKNPR